ncbi:MAG TPA: CapA family protein [Myxococcota bacterium]|nr:CapA family protein [Myxococcota bacterium]
MCRLSYIASVFMGLSALASSGSPGAYAQEKTVKVAVVGHIVIATESRNGWFLPPDNGVGLVEDVAALMADADLRLGNLAAPISTRGSMKHGVDNDRRWAFRTPPRYAGVLDTLGLDVVLAANNHIFDYGPLAYADTLATLDTLAIGHVGRVDEVVRKRINGVRVAIIGFTQPYQPEFQSHHDIELAGEKVAALRRHNDVIIVLVHGGGEGREYRYVRFGKEYAGREYRGQLVKLSRHLVDQGADLVVGFGSHMPRAMELYEGRLIAYALGNFLTYGPFDLKLPNNLSAILEVEFGKSGKPRSAKLEPVRLKHPGVPYPDKKGWATNYLRKISKANFPDSPLVILKDGTLQLRPPKGKPVETAGARKPVPEAPRD